MEVTSSYAGSSSRPLEREVTWRHAMNFAASVQDHNPWYFDDEREDGIVAPPMLAVALTWPFGESASTYWDEKKFPLDLLVRQVHYTEQIVFDRPLRPGDKLTITADLPMILPHRAGTYMIIRCTARDQKGDRVFIEYAGTLLRGVKCTDKGTTVEAPPETPRFRGDNGPLWENVTHLGPMAAHIYDGCADIHNPIHTSQRFAKWVGLPGIIVHGSCTLSVALRDIVNREANGDPRRVKRLGCRFTGMVLPDTDITVRALGRTSGEDTDWAHFEVLNGDKRRAISDGFVEFARG
ncbi:MAG: MaoC family dehydratase N-terminal domain-containing protein [Candidatus Hydrogenedentes bacterium]|nr:MaoC family dehydratase N-terminal domain-containing protein [Candidatus Hydrogenedentota bacterium]